MRNITWAPPREENDTDHRCDGERSDSHDNDAVDSPDSAERADGRGDAKVSAPEVMRGEQSQREIECGEGERPAGCEYKHRRPRNITNGMRSHRDRRYGNARELEPHRNSSVPKIDEGNEQCPRENERKGCKGRAVDVHVARI